MTHLLTQFEAEKVLGERRSPGASIGISLDLGLSIGIVQITQTGIEYEDRPLAAWGDPELIHENTNNVFIRWNGGWELVKAYSAEFDRAYSLYPTTEAPTMLIFGIPMHRIKGTTPWQDTKMKIKALGPAYGNILDTSTGLGYAAIWAAKKASTVTTIELDPVVLEICRVNPWSAGLFTLSNIDQRIGHSWDVIEDMEDGVFSGVLHDPPAMPLAGDLYSLDYYTELYRVMKSGGTLFHYIGDPNSKSGHATTTGVIRRLERVGFSTILKRPKTFGVVAKKGDNYL